LTPRPNVGGLYSAHGGYCGPAVKPIALHLVQQIASDPEVGLPISGIGGVSGWREAAEFFLLGCGTVQVCTAAMRYGYRIVEDMIDGLSQWMDEKGFRTIDDFRGSSLPKLTEWKHLDLNYRIVARINRQTCIGCDLCYIACWDGAHQCIHLDGQATPAAVETASNARIVTTPIAKLDVAAVTPSVTPSHPHSTRRRGGMRGLQSVLAGLPGGELHRHGAGGDGQAVPVVGNAERTMNTLIRNGTVVTAKRRARPMS
jgi:dihydropyrimidine dehydrogenase (NAD+) subunit PreA